MQELDEKVAEFVRSITAAMGLTLDVTVEELSDNLRLNLSGEGADVLLRRKGEALDALQVIVNTAFRRDARGDRHYVVDALGFRKGKDAELRASRRKWTHSTRTRGASCI
jgi:spoIIIJ-associated protein